MKNTMKFLPLLILYISAVLVASVNIFQGDEGRYVMFATNLLQGFYSPLDNIDLWNGPGYPIVLVPFVLLKLPWLTAKLLNAVFLFIAIIYFYNTLRLYIEEKPAVYFSYILGLYFPCMRGIHLLVTENFVYFLVCGFLFHFCKLHQSDEKWKTQLIITSLFLCYLALTKVFFGYVILVCLLIYLLLYFWKKKNTFRKTSLVYLLAFIFCLPYLFYTYSLTGKAFYWGNSGSMSLYWMSSPYENDLGDWHSFKETSENPQLSKNHQKLFNKLLQMDSISQDEAFKKRAVQNIISNPKRFFKNWIANIGRMLFSYPFSYTPQKLTTFFYLVPNMFIVVFSVLCLYPAYLGRRLIPFEIHSLALFGLIAFGGSSFLSAYSRQFIIIVPIVSLWIIFVLSRVVKIEVLE